LLPDLAAAWGAIAREEAVTLAPRGTSFRRWAHRLAGEAQSEGRVGELSFWRGMLRQPALSLVAGALDPVRDSNASAEELTLTLPAPVTAALLTRVPAAFHAGINDVLLTGLTVAIADWCRRHGRGGECAALIGFNYLGRFPAAGGGDWAAASEEVKLPGGDPAIPLAHCIEINALTIDGAQGPTLRATWSWASALRAREEVRDLAEGWYRA